MNLFLFVCLLVFVYFAYFILSFSVFVAVRVCLVRLPVLVCARCTVYVP